MKVLLVADEFFSWGVYGGFGAFTRKLGRELVNYGVEVEAYIHKVSAEQKPVGQTEWIDGVAVKTLPRGNFAKLRHGELYTTNADLIHSQCGRLDTFLTFRRNTHLPQIVTVQDFRTKKDLEAIGEAEKKSFPRRVWASIVKNLYGNALREASVVACQARLLEPKLRETFRLKREIRFLPNFVDLPNEKICKSDAPTVVWLGRLDPIKRPELCFEVAKKTPRVEFYILGRSHIESENRRLKQAYRKVENLHFMGFQTGQAKAEILKKAWVLINTSIYECLPISFLEAMSYECALLSTQNPDDYTNMFGIHVEPTVQSLTSGLSLLLMNDTWRGLGEKGHEHILRVHSTEKGVKAHMKLYKELID